MKTYALLLTLTLCIEVGFPQSAIDKEKAIDLDLLKIADNSLDLILDFFGSENTILLQENFPASDDYRAGYLANERVSQQKYAYLWPFSGGLSATVALYEQTKNEKYQSLLDTKLIPGLQAYYDVQRQPAGYASYLSIAPPSDRFYDDNIWIGIDFTNLYLLTGNKKFLEKALVVWDFVYSGFDQLLGGGIYWCEQKKTSKNTCSNAPAAVFALKLYEATQERKYIDLAKSIYDWTKIHLQDVDALYMDHIRLDGHIDRTKYPYNSGQMIEAAGLLYKLTKDHVYLEEAQRVAESSFHYFFEIDNGTRRLKNSDQWFIAVMMRGFVQLYKLDNNPAYLDAFLENLTFACTSNRDENGLFYKDWKGENKEERKWLLDQFAIVEMLANITVLRK